MVFGYVRRYGDHLPRHRFVVMILGISCLYEIALTVLDYQMKVMGVAKFRAAALRGEGGGSAASENFAALMGRFGQATNGLSLLLSLLGTSLIVRKLGLPFTLTVFPVLLVLAIVVSYFHPSLWVLFVAVSMLKGLTYALNEPCKEMLYMVTSDSIKFKAKAWIDVFGSRVAKGMGSIITGTSKGNKDVLITYGSFAIFLVSLGLLGLSLVVGQEFSKLVRTGQIIGDSDDSAAAALPAHLRSKSRSGSGHSWHARSSSGARSHSGSVDDEDGIELPEATALRSSA
ncbi:hypothetical protein JKP88DRAFT_354609 [Tribonema minus]|uniref:ADP,ATP carrier protein n=1 Tax=Tribonema minus TaxID=303371 RepID=A0A836CFM2_9STRA|nr:hypothetical protein JKP88DRAFT_354609 [Tribonema minus]